MDAVLKKPLRESVNMTFVLSVTVFTLLVLGIVALFAVPYFETLLTHGIKDLGNGVTAVDLKSMSNFHFDDTTGRVADVPAEYRALDGKKVVLEGEMWNKQAAGPEVPQFQLCYSIAKCCFSGPPQVQHFVDSTVVNGGSVPYYSGLVSVTGTLHVNVKVDQEVGKVVSVYQLDVERVEPK